MRTVTVLLDPDGLGIADEIRSAYEALPRARGLRLKWQVSAHAAVLMTWDESYSDPLVVGDGDHIAVGIVRLDNRADAERWADCEHEGLTDLEVVRRIVARCGATKIASILGDFAFVVWDGSTRTGIAACDAFGVNRLYWTEGRGLVAFSSRAESLAIDGQYDVRYLTEFIARGMAPPDRTVYANVRPVPAASLAVVDRRPVRIHRYWDAADFDVEYRWATSEQQAIERCRQLLVEAVRVRVDGAGRTWAQLSGGLDSSSVVSLVQWLAERGEIAHGLAGTVTMVDRAGSAADERQYSNAVVQRWPTRNEVIVDAPTWAEPGYAPPRTDQPRFDLLAYPRDRRMCAAVRAGDGRVLLTGWGGDEVFGGSMLFFADWIARGRIGPALREMARRAAVGRVSFWELAYRNALLPLLPTAVQRRLVRNTDDMPIPPWLERTTLRHYGLSERSPSLPEYEGGLGDAYRHAIATRIASLPAVMSHGMSADMLDLRHPLVYRPLVEFALRLPPELRARPHAHRWVLREAMRGILPEKVRTRIGKPTTGDFLVRSLAAEQQQLAPLLQQPVLEELGVIDGARLRDAFRNAIGRTSGGAGLDVPIGLTLALEAWLQMRSDRWPRGGHHSSARR